MIYDDTPLEDIIVPHIEPDWASIAESVAESDKAEYDRELEAEHRILSHKHTPSYLVEVFGKATVLEIVHEKVKELTLHRRALPQYFNRKLAFFKHNHHPLYAELVSYQLEMRLTASDATLDRLASLYLAITSPDSLKGNPNHLTEQQIQQAREYPTHTLFEGRLIKSGRNFKALCPFHLEKTPSFYFYESGSFHCFGCGAHGKTAIDYVMQMDKSDFPSAARRLL